MASAADVIDLSAEPIEPVNRALSDLRRNLSHFLISSMDPGPEIEFGDYLLKFKAKVPATAMAYLVSEDHDRVDALRGYIRLCLLPESRDDFEEILDDIPLEALNAIVEYISEVQTSFPTK